MEYSGNFHYFEILGHPHPPIDLHPWIWPLSKAHYASLPFYNLLLVGSRRLYEDPVYFG